MIQGGARTGVPQAVKDSHDPYLVIEDPYEKMGQSEEFERLVGDFDENEVQRMPGEKLDKMMSSHSVWVVDDGTGTGDVETRLARIVPHDLASREYLDGTSGGTYDTSAGFLYTRPNREWGNGTARMSQGALGARGGWRRSCRRPPAGRGVPEFWTPGAAG